MHTYLSFLSFLYWICLVLFYLSLSLSLSLSVSLRMAPKCKSALSWNPLRSRATSCSDPTPSSIWFYDDKSHQDFSENFSRPNINSEREVILSDFSDTDLPTIIYNRGWESLYDNPITCPSMIIQEFYSNMHNFDYFVPLFITHMRGTRIVVTLNLISKVLHIPRVEFADYLGYPRLQTVSKDELMSLFCETPLSWGER